MFLYIQIHTQLTTLKTKVIYSTREICIIVHHHLNMAISTVNKVPIKTYLE